MRERGVVTERVGLNQSFHICINISPWIALNRSGSICSRAKANLRRADGFALADAALAVAAVAALAALAALAAFEPALAAAALAAPVPPPPAPPSPVAAGDAVCVCVCVSVCLSVCVVCVCVCLCVFVLYCNTPENELTGKPAQPLTI